MEPTEKDLRVQMFPVLVLLSLKVVSVRLLDCNLCSKNQLHVQVSFAVIFGMFQYVGKNDVFNMAMGQNPSIPVNIPKALK